MEIYYKKIGEIKEEDYKNFFTLSAKCCNFNKDKKINTTENLMLNKALNDIFNISINEVKILRNKFGKPFIYKKDIFFNFSHSKDYIVLVVSNNSVGVDIQYIKKYNADIAKKCFHSSEVSKICNKEDFYLIWCLKEAYIKCIGKNFTHVGDVEFIRKDGNKLLTNSRDFEFTEYKIIDKYKIVACEKK